MSDLQVAISIFLVFFFSFSQSKSHSRVSIPLTGKDTLSGETTLLIFTPSEKGLL